MTRNARYEIHPNSLISGNFDSYLYLLGAADRGEAKQAKKHQHHLICNNQSWNRFVQVIERLNSWADTVSFKDLTIGTYSLVSDLFCHIRSLRCN